MKESNQQVTIKLGIKEMEAGRYIAAPQGVRLEVANNLGISVSTMNAALRYERHGEKSEKARELVLGSGQAVIMRYLPECETIHDKDGIMMQVFPNGYTILVHKDTGAVEVYNNLGVLKSRDYDPCITEFSALQYKVANSQSSKPE